jgi:hypothetical protein
LGQGRTPKTEREFELPIFRCHAVGVESSPEGDTSCVFRSARLRVDLRVRRRTERGYRNHDGAQPRSAAGHDHEAAVTTTASAASTTSTSGPDLCAATSPACGSHATTRSAAPPTRGPPTCATEKEEGGRTGDDDVWTATAPRNHAAAAGVSRGDGRAGGEPQLGIVLEPLAASPRDRARALADRGRNSADPTRTSAKACRDRGLRAA